MPLAVLSNDLLITFLAAILEAPLSPAIAPPKRGAPIPPTAAPAIEVTAKGTNWPVPFAACVIKPSKVGSSQKSPKDCKL